MATDTIPAEAILWPREFTNARQLEAHLLDAHLEEVTLVPREQRGIATLTEWHKEAHEAGRMVVPHYHVWR